ncbi:unnamed protein product [Oikopleura dioica]|uniref:C2H2-type domain-containing protein n=1 Tax=Oikopleura dioica TaxID=34765 RepID=E4X4E3_OIKDI|nr:unnamed protein product [Oikopleura dioica]
MEVLSPLRPVFLPTEAKVIRLKRLSEAVNLPSPKVLRQSSPYTSPARKTARFSFSTKTPKRTTLVRKDTMLPSEIAEEKMYACELCPKTFFHRTALDIHCESHDTTLPRSRRSTGSSMTSLKVNSIEFLGEIEKELKDELDNAHKKKLKCMKCGKRFRSKAKIVLHSLIKHS